MVHFWKVFISIGLFDHRWLREMHLIVLIIRRKHFIQNGISLELLIYEFLISRKKPLFSLFWSHMYLIILFATFFVQLKAKCDTFPSIRSYDHDECWMNVTCSRIIQEKIIIRKKERNEWNADWIRCQQLSDGLNKNPQSGGGKSFYNNYY